MMECAATRSQLLISGDKAVEILPVEQRKSSMLTIEEYIEFHSSNKQLDLTVNHLDQIMTMHGFKRLRGSKKDAKVEAMKSMDLIDPERSTLKEDSVSSKAFLTAKEVLTDLSMLHWPECCTTSILTLNSLNHEQKSTDDSSTTLSTKSKAAKSSSTRSRKKKRSSESSVDLPSITADSSSELTTHDSASKSSTGGGSGPSVSAATGLREVNGDAATAIKPNFSKRKKSSKKSSELLSSC